MCELMDQLSVHFTKDIAWLISTYMRGEILQLFDVVSLENRRIFGSCKIVPVTRDRALVLDTVRKELYEYNLAHHQLRYMSSTRDNKHRTRPNGIAKITRHHVAVTDALQNSVKIFDLQGKLVKTWATPNVLDFPANVALIKKGLVAVADCNHHCIKVFTTKGKFLAQWESPLLESKRRKFHPVSISKISKNLVAVADFFGHCVDIFTRKGKHVTTWYGAVTNNNNTAMKKFRCPSEIVKLKKDRIAILSKMGTCIQIVNKEGQFITEWSAPEEYSLYFMFDDLMRTASGDLLSISRNGRQANLFKLVMG